MRRNACLFPDGRTLDVNVPAGAESGTVLRLRNQGQPGMGGGPAGDALIEITVEPHPQFRRDGNNVLVDVPITLTEAVMGEDQRADDQRAREHDRARRIQHRHAVAAAWTGIAPKGGAAGDQYITLKVMLPKEPDTALGDFIQNWPGRNYEVRGG